MSPRRRPVREYSRDFDMTGQPRKQLIIVTPPALHAAVMRKARRTGTSVRSLVLTYLQNWSSEQ